MAPIVKVEDIRTLEGKIEKLERELSEAKLHVGDKDMGATTKLLDIAQTKAELLATRLAYAAQVGPTENETASAADAGPFAKGKLTKDELTALAKGNNRGYVITTEDGKVLYKDSDIDNFLEANGYEFVG